MWHGFRQRNALQGSQDDYINQSDFRLGAGTMAKRCAMRVYACGPLLEIVLPRRLCSRLPERTREKIMKTIQEDYFGEQQPGTAFIVKNSGKNEKYKHIAFLCLARVADASVPIEFAYTAMRGLILAVLEFNKHEASPIEMIAVPSFALNTSTLDQKRYVLTSPIMSPLRVSFR